MAKRCNLEGQKFYKLTAIAPTEKRGHGGRIWLCVCECGQEIEVDAHDLKSGRVRSCGCSKHAPGDYSGVRRGNLTGIRRTGRTITHRGREREVWEWRCDCGARVEKALFQVYPKGSPSCSKCAAKRDTERRKQNLVKSRVEGTNLTKGQLRSLLEGKVPASNTSGVRGVSWCKNANKWTAHGTIDKKQYHLGYFSDIEDAIRARQEFLNKHYPSLDEIEKRTDEK